MGRKKHQHEPNQNSGESTESYDENQNSTKCPHLNKAVDLQRVKKGLLKCGFRKDCEDCCKNTVPNGFDVPNDMEFDDSLWLCLKCGNQACGRNANQHALKHYSTPRSDCHTVCLNTTNWQVWCYECDDSVNTTASKKLLEAVEYLKKSSDQDKIRPERSSATSLEAQFPVEIMETDIQVKLNTCEPSTIKKTVGLINLGNTCFFNAVMQCLSHTPFLLELLRETSNDLQEFRLPGGKLVIDEETTLDLEPLEGNLEPWNKLAKSLAETMEVLQNGKPNVFSPKALHSMLTQRIPQFVIGEQHDSHELLRHLLEAVREEDFKRYQIVILHKFGLSRKTIPANVERETQKIIKFYGQQASELLSPTEQVFRGVLVSTLQCEDCSHTSHREEFFLDLSLPITEKTIPPMLRRKADEIEDKSKYQMKKEKRAAKKNKRNRGPKIHDRSSEAITSIDDNDNNSGSQSDADVEDNIEDHKTSTNQQLLEKSNLSCIPALEFMDTVSTTTVSTAMEVGENSSSSSEAEIKLPNSPVEINSSPKDEKKEFERPESRLSFVHNSKGDLKEDLEKLSLLNDGDSQKVDSIFNKEDEVAGAICNDNEEDQKMDEDEDDSDIWMGTMAPRYQCEEGECSVQSCLNQFTACELMTSNNKVSCELCTKRNGGGNAEKKTVYTNALKQLLIYNPPAVLILHLKRFQVCHFRPTKLSKHVSFPIQLDLAPYLSKRSQNLATFEPGQTQVLYSLYGVVEHSGSMHGGHYVAYVKVRPKLDPNNYRWQFLPKNQKQKNPEELKGARGIPDVPPGRWYHVSDSQVTEVQEAKVLNAQAYLLFYERIY